MRQLVEVTGVVQGVGFRPYVYGLAGELGLTGFVCNESSGVRIEIEGPDRSVRRFTNRLRAEAPALARIETLDVRPVDPLGDRSFRIAPSANAGAVVGERRVSPDVAPCADCLGELFDPTDRRYRHPFITCTNCGPRYTIITALPYDRPHTTMATFELCPACAAEYRDPRDRRFHAQPLACPACGPSLRYDGDRAVVGTDAVLAAAHGDLAAGRIVAVKGIGGYHLACDASAGAALCRLRTRKHRPDKPFAVMVADLDAARAIAHVDEVERAALESPIRPIVLLRSRADTAVSAEVAPGHATIGVMLPSSPLHHLLFRPVPAHPGPIPTVLVMTSGNRADEPICFDDREAARRLAGVADSFCSHDRPIRVPCDDSIVRVIDGGVVPIRRSRGIAPAPVALPFPVEPTLAVGGEMKNTCCLARGRTAWLSQHLGDMGDLETFRAFEASVADLGRFHDVHPVRFAIDGHPGYRTHRWAKRRASSERVIEAQHHHAHLAALMAEHGCTGADRMLGFVFDGTGLGADGGVWGGEVLLGGYRHVERVASLVAVPLPGGDSAIRNPWRMALAHLAASGVAWDADLAAVRACTAAERVAVDHQLEGPAASARTTSMGRLFDAVASLLDVCHRTTYEGQAAIELESLAASASGAVPDLTFHIEGGRIDPAPVVRSIVERSRSGCPSADLALAFHLAVADMIAAVARRTLDGADGHTVGLSGGCFQNALLAEATIERLRADDVPVLTHRVVPPNDGGLALGQVAIAAHAPEAGRTGGVESCA